jgi:peptidoglycan/LPS O-acetylase OafA/YrhL
MGRTRQNESNGRLAYVDGWRGVAILLVLMTHAWAEAEAPALSFHVGSHTVALAAIPAIGYVGVNLFLVLSGLCLTFPFMRDPTLRDRTTIGSFWLRRVRRIVPAYYISILMILLLWAGFRTLASHLPDSATGRVPTAPAPVTLADLGSHLLFLHNMRPENVCTINSSYWSLAMEFQLYLLFPLLLEAAVRWGPWRVAGIVLATQLIYRFTLDFLLWDPKLEVMTAYEFVAPKAMLGRMFDFSVGMTAAYVINRPPRSTLHWMLLGRWAGIAGLACLLAAFTLKVMGGHILVTYTVQDVLWALGFGLVVCWSSRNGTLGCRLLSFGPLVKIGLFSYSLYLIHQPIIYCLSQVWRMHVKAGPAFVANLASLPLVIGIAWLFFLCFEAPFMRRPTRTPERVVIAAPEPTYAQ